MSFEKKKTARVGFTGLLQYNFLTLFHSDVIKDNLSNWFALTLESLTNTFVFIKCAPTILGFFMNLLVIYYLSSKIIKSNTIIPFALFDYYLR